MHSGDGLIGMGQQYTASNYDSTNDYQTRSAELTGIADGKAGTVSGWFRLAGGDGVAQVLMSNRTVTTTGPTIVRGSTNVLAIRMSNSASVNVLVHATTRTYLAGSGWHWFGFSWNLSAGLAIGYVDDIEAPAATTLTDDTIDYTTGNWAIGALTNGNSKFNGDLSGLLFHTSFLDLSLLANRRKLITSNRRPATITGDASSVLGVQPLIWAPNGDASNNLGSGGNFTTTGALTASSSSPSI